MPVRNNSWTVEEDAALIQAVQKKVSFTRLSARLRRSESQFAQEHDFWDCRSLEQRVCRGVKGTLVLEVANAGARTKDATGSATPPRDGAVRHA